MLKTPELAMPRTRKITTLCNVQIGGDTSCHHYFV